MKIRHVRAIAVFGVAVVALTGARGSHGGSCSGGSSHGSSSSSSGGTSGGSHDNDTTTSGGSTGSLTGGGSSAHKAERDVRIDECKLDASGKNLTAKITVTNNDSLTYDYDVSMQFKGDLGESVDLAIAKVDNLKVAAGASETSVATTPYTGSGDGSEYKKCEVISASRTAA
ncbi:hypothetical protein ACQEVG_02255 [Streptomyces sp. CA-135486]|uniref:hypothetical protein n=1 Tax=Streptomyces sp. CA-135486 TaxID=3240049 RepID=UPI003D947071